MVHPENNDSNRYELASKILSGWSREDLEAYVITEFVDDYRDGLGCFEEHWDDFKDSFDWSEDLRESMKKEVPNETKEAQEARK